MATNGDTVEGGGDTVEGGGDTVEGGGVRGKVRGGIRKTLQAPRAVGRGFGWAASGTKAQLGKAGHAVGGGVGRVASGPRARISRLVERARERPAVAIAITVGVVLSVAWMAWAIYVTAENGANAGLGVLITWPVLIGALALIASPFVLTWMLVKRFRPDGETNPPVAGGD